MVCIVVYRHADMPSKELSPLNRWGQGRKRGWPSRLMYATHLSSGVIVRARAGKMVNFRSAMLLERHTGIPAHLLTDDPAAQPEARKMSAEFEKTPPQQRARKRRSRGKEAA